MKKWVALYFLLIFLIISNLYFLIGDNDMKTYRYIDLEIISAQKPRSQMYWIEMNSSGIIYTVPASGGVGKTIYKTTDKGANWGDIETRANNLIGGVFKNSTDLYFGECSATTSYIFKVDTTDDSITEMSNYTAGTSELCTMPFIIGSEIYTLNIYIDGANYYIRIRIWNSGGGTWDIEDTWNIGGATGVNAGQVVVIGTKAYFVVEDLVGGTVIMTEFDSGTSTITSLDDIIATPSWVSSGLAYDGRDTLYFGIRNGGVNYLASYSIAGDVITQLGEYNIILMADWQTASGVLEKAFGFASEIVYELKSNRGGIVQLQDCSTITDNNVWAISDTFFINNDGDMFEYTDVEAYMSYFLYRAGIIPFEWKASFECHPDYNIYWNLGDSIKIYDPSDVVEFWGKIITKSQLTNGLYYYTVDAFINELFRVVHEETYATKTTSEIQTDILDDSADYCYQSSSIVATATPYNYIYNRAMAYIFKLGRFLERQVPYVEPEGKVWVKAYDALTATGESWDILDTTQNVDLIDIPEIDEQLPGSFDGRLGITRTLVRYKDNTLAIRPATYEDNEITGIIPLNEFRDPKIQAATEANQLGDNLYTIFSAQTKFLGLRIEGKGYLQPGTTIEIENTGQITISQDDFLIVYFIRDAKMDLYRLMVVSDNIIFPHEFTTYFNTIRDQESIQTLENQAAMDTIKTNFNKAMKIGSGNTGWINCILEGSGGAGFSTMNVFDALRNVGGDDMYPSFGIPLPYQIYDLDGNVQNLIITQFKIGVADADANDYVDQIKLYAWSDHETGALLATEDTNRTAAGEYTTNHADATIGGAYERVLILVSCVNTTAAELDITYVQVQYYYG